MNILRLFFIIVITIVLNGCSSMPNSISTQSTPVNNTGYSIEHRKALMTDLTAWTLTGKIAFINQKNRESANVFWQKKAQQQQLTLTTYLGIQVLSLKTNNGIHTLEVDGEEYQSSDLENLILQLTGYTLPITTLEHWLKGVEASATDTIEYAQQTNLPQKLISIHNNEQWQISYSAYKEFNGLPLATKFTIKQRDLTIRIQINKWAL